MLEAFRLAVADDARAQCLGGLASGSSVPSTKFSTADLSRQFPGTIEGLIAEPIGLLSMLKIRDDHGQIVHPVYVSSASESDEDSDNGQTEKTTKKAATRRIHRHVRVSSAMPTNSTTSLLRLSGALLHAAIKRDNKFLTDDAGNRPTRRSDCVLPRQDAVLKLMLRTANVADLGNAGVPPGPLSAPQRLRQAARILFAHASSDSTSSPLTGSAAAAVLHANRVTEEGAEFLSLLHQTTEEELVELSQRELFAARFESDIERGEAVEFVTVDVPRLSCFASAYLKPVAEALYEFTWGRLDEPQTKRTLEGQSAELLLRLLVGVELFRWRWVDAFCKNTLVKAATVEVLRGFHQRLRRLRIVPEGTLSVLHSRWGLSSTNSETPSPAHVGEVTMDDWSPSFLAALGGAPAAVCQLQLMERFVGSSSAPPAYSPKDVWALPLALCAWDAVLLELQAQRCGTL